MAHPNEGDKRQQILKAAVTVFSRKGFHEAKVDEIAQLADVGKGTVYEYFSSKTELFQEMFKAGMEFYLDNLSKELKPKQSCREKLIRVSKLHLRFVVHYKDLARITMTEPANISEDFRKSIFKHRAKKIDLLKQIIDEGIESGEFRKVNSYAAALTFSGSLGALFSPIIFSKDKPSYNGLIEPMLDIIFSGLLK